MDWNETEGFGLGTLDVVIAFMMVWVDVLMRDRWRKVTSALNGEDARKGIQAARLESSGEGGFASCGRPSGRLFLCLFVLWRLFSLFSALSMASAMT